jgi:hypothetical protein
MAGLPDRHQGITMLTYQDCVALCGLHRREVEAIAEHEHVPPIVAAELGNYLCRNPAGELCIQRYILDDIAAAEKRADRHHLAVLQAVLKHFVHTHPERHDAGPDAKASGTKATESR